MGEMMDRIRDEMAAHTGDQTIQMIGEHMTEYLRQRPDAALREGATIQGAIGAMKAEAAKMKGKNNWAALDFLTGMEIVYGAFGLKFDRNECVEIQATIYGVPLAVPGEKKVVTPAKAETKAPADEFDLDALLGDM